MTRVYLTNAVLQIDGRLYSNLKYGCGNGMPHYGKLLDSTVLFAGFDYYKNSLQALVLFIDADLPEAVVNRARPDVRAWTYL